VGLPNLALERLRRVIAALAVLTASPFSSAWTDIVHGTLIETGTSRPLRVTAQQPGGRVYWSQVARRRIDTSGWRLGRNSVVIGAGSRTPRRIQYHVRPFVAAVKARARDVVLRWPDLGRRAYYVTAHGPDGARLFGAWVYATRSPLPSAPLGRTTYTVSAPSGVTSRTWVDRIDFATERKAELFFPLNDTTKTTIGFSWDEHPQDAAYYLQIYTADGATAVWQGYTYSSVTRLDLPRGAYKWRVTAFADGGVAGRPSPWAYFESRDSIEGLENLLGQNPLATAPADRAGLLYPEDAVFLPNGDLLIADTMRHVLRRVRDREVVVAAGTGVAGFNGDGPATQVRLDRPAGLLLAPNGRVIVADHGNFLLREFDPQMATIRTLAGVPGRFGRSGPTGELESQALGYLKHMAWRNGELVVAMATRHFWPRAGREGLRGMLYAFRNGRFVPLRQSTAIEATQIAGFAWEGADLWLVVRDFAGTNHLVRLNAFGTPVLWKEAGRFAQGVVSLGGGRALVGRHSTVAEFTGAGFVTRMHGFANVAMLRPLDRRVLVVDGDAFRVELASTASWNRQAIVENGQNSFAAPVSLAMESGGTLLVLVNQPSGLFRHCQRTGATRRIAFTGGLDFALGAGDARLSPMRFPTDLTVRGDGGILVSEQNGIWEVDPVTSFMRLVAGAPRQPGRNDGAPLQARFSSVRGMREDARGNLFIADARNRLIRMLSARTGLVTTVAGDGTHGGNDPARWYGRPATSVGLNQPLDVLPADGGLYIVQAWRNVISFRDSGGLLRPWAGVDIHTGYQGQGAYLDGPRRLAMFNTPSHIEWLGQGDLLVTDQFNHVVRVVGDEARTVVGTGAPGFAPDMLNLPTAALRAGGRIIVADAGNGMVRAAP
jgi:hypothetical protein